MATRSIPTETRTQLNQLLNQWGTRWRLRRVLLYLPRIIMVTSLIGMIVAIVVALFRLMPATQLIMLASVAMGLTFVLITSGIGLWSKRGYDAARQFDSLFGLQERITTALELMDGRIRTAPEIAERQLQDAYETAKNVDVRKQIPLRVKWVEWLGALALILLLIVVLALAAFRADTEFETISAETQSAISAAADTTRDITEEIAIDSNLTDEERNSLLESTEATLDELENPNISAEDSFVAMSDLESELRDQLEAMRDQVERSNSELQSALDELNGEQQSPSENPGEDLANSLSEQQGALENMTQEEREELAQNLSDAADALREENEELASDMENAATNIDENQLEQAQGALGDAAEEAQSTSQSNQSRGESADSMEAAADAAQQAAGDIAESERQEGQESEGDGQGSESEQGEQGSQSEQSGSDSDGEQSGGEQIGEEGQPMSSAEQGEQAGGESAAAENASQSNTDESSDGDSGGQGAGAGNNSSDQSTQDLAGSGGTNDQFNTSNDGGETAYDPIFAPLLENLQAGQTNMELEADDESAPSVEGDFQENPTGVSSVPYNQVFTTYANAASSALENGYVPLGVRDVVRDYFTSIEPTGDQ